MSIRYLMALAFLSAAPALGMQQESFSEEGLKDLKKAHAPFSEAMKGFKQDGVDGTQYYLQHCDKISKICPALNICAALNQMKSVEKEKNIKIDKEFAQEIQKTGSNYTAMQNELDCQWRTTSSARDIVISKLICNYSFLGLMTGVFAQFFIQGLMLNLLIL